MKKSFFIALLLPLSLSILLAGCMEKVREIPMSVEVREGKAIGANTDSSVLDFSILPPDSSSTKTITVSNNKSAGCFFEVSVKGETSNWVGVQKNFSLEPGEEKELEVKVTVPKNAEPGKYSGTLIIMARC